MKPKNFVSENIEKCSLCVMMLLHMSSSKSLCATSENLNKSAVLRHSLCDTMHMKACHERHAFEKLLYLLSQYGQHSWEELKLSVAPIECIWFYRCLLGNSDSCPKVPLYMLHTCDMINLPFSGNTRLAVFVLHSLYL